MALIAIVFNGEGTFSVMASSAILTRFHCFHGHITLLIGIADPHFKDFLMAVSACCSITQVNVMAEQDGCKVTCVFIGDGTRYSGRGVWWNQIKDKRKTDVVMMSRLLFFILNSYKNSWWSRRDSSTIFNHPGWTFLSSEPGNGVLEWLQSWFFR